MCNWGSVRFCHKLESMPELELEAKDMLRETMDGENTIVKG